VVRRLVYPYQLKICNANCPTDEEPPQIKIGELAFGGVKFEGRGQGRERPRSVVAAWKTVTKLFGRVTAS
jgi:hypothetical protein